MHDDLLEFNLPHMPYYTQLMHLDVVHGLTFLNFMQHSFTVGYATQAFACESSFVVHLQHIKIV